MKEAANKKPGRLETRLSMALLAILFIVGVGVAMRQFQINPAVVALRPESHQHALPAESNQPAVIDATGSGIIPFSAPERFGPDTLYEKINGRADLYLSSGFSSLGTQRFSMDSTAGAWVEVFAYEMGTPENAFSVFSMQRREDARTVDIAHNAYRTENAVFMTHGNVYLEIIGTDTSEEIQQVIGLLAQVYVKAHGGTTAARAPGADLFPEAGMAPNSLQLIAANAFGYEQLDRIYSCEYLIDGVRLTAFASERESREAASALVVAYSRALMSYGATAVEGSVSIDGAVVMQFFDTYDIVFSRGPYLAGVHEAADPGSAAILSGRLAAHLEGLTGK